MHPMEISLAAHQGTHSTSLRGQAQGRFAGTQSGEGREEPLESLEFGVEGELSLDGRLRGGGGREVGGGEQVRDGTKSQAQILAGLFSPGCSAPGPDSRPTSLGPNLPSALTPQPRSSRVSCLTRPPARGWRRRAGISWRGHKRLHPLLDAGTTR